MKTGDRVKNLQNELNILYKQYDIRDKRIVEYIESLGLEPHKNLMKYPQDCRYDISDFIDKTNIFQIRRDMIDKQELLVNAVEAYLKLECYESYKKNKLEKVFRKAREDEDSMIDLLILIEKFICE